ncbi:MAG: hypothetical protein M4579_001909 [Chaenotheca gracillima]|nr:MAG: hypothetical protein M4579_001909 [Chaenotheca gracillima]
MEDLLTPLRSVKITHKQAEENALVPARSQASRSHQSLQISNLDDALQLLRSKPSKDDLTTTLRYLENESKQNSTIHTPSPRAAQLANLLVGTVIPDFWNTFKSKDSLDFNERSAQELPVLSAEVHIFLTCLKTVPGLGAIIARLRSLLTLFGDSKDKAKSSVYAQHLSDLLEVTTLLLNDDNYVWVIWQNSSRLRDIPTKLVALWKEFISLICMGKLLSTAAEASTVLEKSAAETPPNYWISDGARYSRWLGRNVHHMLICMDAEDQTSLVSLAQFLGRSLSLGYSDQLVSEMLSGLVKDKPTAWERASNLRRTLKTFEQRTFFAAVLKNLGQYARHSQSINNNETWWQLDQREVGGAAAIISNLTADDESLKDYLVSWLTGFSDTGQSSTLFIPRAVFAVVQADEERLRTVLEKSMQQFGDNLFIKHKPMMHQEANAKTLLLAAGYVHRLNPICLFTLARSSTHLNAISNRLAASSIRSRFLGMIVGMAISKLIDKPENAMNFSMEEVETPEAKWYLSITRVHDALGSVDDLHSSEENNALVVRNELQTPMKGKPKIASEKKAGKNKKNKPATVDPDSSDEEEFTPYAKPDSDPEDSDEDPTTIQRSKPSAPVYIRNLLSYLRASDSYDKFRLGLINAPALIRRKSHFGTEVSDHAIELATLLTGLRDPFSLEHFEQLRLQSMIAVLLSDPLTMAQWFARSIFEGDYSLGQRASMVTTLGLSARELAGFSEEDSSSPEAAFASKMLPEKIHKMYSAQKDPSIDLVASRLERTILEPLALKAADQLSGPTALKVRTFSSRLEVEKKRSKPTSNDLAKVVAEGFFFPVTGRLGMALSSSSSSIFAHHLLLPHILRTLSVLLHASGPNTPLLPQLTNEFWDLCLSLRGYASADPMVREALLFSFLTLLEVNTSNKHQDRSRQLAEENARELVETLSWAEAVLADQPGSGIQLAGSGIGSIGSRTGDIDTGVDEGERAKMLAAGVVVRCREIGEKWRGLMMGQGWEG